MAGGLRSSAGVVVRASANMDGILLLCGGIAIFSLQDVIIKLLSDTYPVHELVFLRGIVALPLLLLVVHYDQGFGTLKTDRPLLVLVRTLCMFASYMFYYLAIAAVPITTVIALFFTCPLFITVLAVPILGEQVGLRTWAGIMIGFAGVLIIARPGLEGAEPASLLAVLSAAAYALGAVLSRRLGDTNSASAMAFYQGLIYIYAGGLIALITRYTEVDPSAHQSIRFLFNPWRMPAGFDMLMIGAVGVISAAGFFLLTQAYRIGSAKTLAPFEYTAMIWAVLLTYLVWHDTPDVFSLAGLGLIVAGGIYVLRRENIRRDKPLAAKGPYRSR